ncbi:hypothetical protein C805_03051 [Eubacterium sp. 14-2]|uniref:hypothetical protein n=1 Tax=Eubacterium sp. 14-2 TaxID=1235790 RepID=UPI0003349E57|nr:hypothetical protein [Eubacterium sp. 14-2]EOT23390.1 hypothetical protein C805_03051 [Eubacterium sp. 14-2]
MYTNDKTYEVILTSVADISMSNWQITKTVDMMTMVNNKFAILSKINKLLENGVNKKDIFVADRSFLISTSYRTYFEKGDTFFGSPQDVLKMCSLGRFYTMEPNEDICKINCLFGLHKKLNSILNNNLKCRIRSAYLAESFSVLFQKSLDQACEVLLDGVLEQVWEKFERGSFVEMEKWNKMIRELDKQKENALKRDRERFEKIMEESKIVFASTYNRLERPVVGVYHQDVPSIEIINADQMFKNGEESETQIKLRRITKNSPVVIALLVTGPMAGFLGYLCYRDHKVNTQKASQNILDIPKDSNTAINNILGTDNGRLINTGNVNNIDSQVKEMAQHNLFRLENVTNRRVMEMEMRREVNIRD